MQVERHYRFALPFAVLEAGSDVHLVAGEDARYTLTGAAEQAGLVQLLRSLDGHRPLSELLGGVPAEVRQRALQLIADLWGERVLVEALPESEPRAGEPCSLVIHGDDGLAWRLRNQFESRLNSAPALHVFCQDTLDETAALAFNELRLTQARPWLWVSTGALARAYVSPIFLPRRGPCLACLFAGFERVSPARDIREALRVHAKQGNPLPRVELDGRTLDWVSQLVAWKLETYLAATPPVATTFRLHVLETGTFEVATHPVPVDPDCSAQCFAR